MANKVIFFFIIASLCGVRGEQEFECPQGYDIDLAKGAFKRCYKVMAEKEGVEFNNINCMGGSTLPIPISRTANRRLEAYVREYFKKKKIKFQGIWLDLKRSSRQGKECYEPYHLSNSNRGKVTPCYDKMNLGYWKFVNGDIAGSAEGDCVHMIVSEKRFFYPQWKRASCESTKMPFVCEAKPCPKGLFRCQKNKETTCVAKHAVVCTGIEDCDNGADEEGCTGCGGTIKLPKGSITSPNYPNKYKSNTKCRWTIQVGVSQKIHVKIHAIDLEVEGDDKLVIFDGDESKRKVLKELKGNKIANIPISSSNVVTVLFSTDNSIAEDGFNLTYEAVSPINQKLKASSNRQFIASPRYPSAYYAKFNTANMEANFLITAQPGSVITLQFHVFDLASTDTVVIWDGPDKTKPIIHKYTGSSLPHVVAVSFGNTMLVTFRTDLMEERKGFKASYIEGCKADFTGYAALESPGRNSYKKYPHNLKCTFRVVQQTNLPLSISFEDEFLTEAYNDKVQILCDSTPRVLSGNLTGVNDAKVIKSCRRIVVEFTTDSSGHHKGWRANVSHDCPRQPTTNMLQKNTDLLHVGVEVNYSCSQTGYLLEGVNPQVCGLKGSWSSKTPPTCKLKYCGYPKSIPHGAFRYTVHKLTYGGEIEYHCRPSYHLIGSAKRTCVESGWEDPPKCEEIQCKPDLSKSVSSLRGSQLSVDVSCQTVGCTARFRCKKGYMVTNHKDLTICLEDGQWSGGVPDCEEIKCDPESVKTEFGVVSAHRKIGMKEVIGIHCLPGFQVVPKFSVATCNESGEFDTDLKCQDINECEPVRNNPCGPGKCVNKRGGYICMCNKGYEVQQNHLKTTCVDIDECKRGTSICSHTCENTIGSYRCKCPPNTQEVPGTGECLSQVLCPPLEAPTNGRFQYLYPPSTTQDKIVVSTTAILHCTSGYAVVGEAPVCQPNGTWTDQRPVCNCSQCPQEAFKHSVSHSDGDTCNYNSVAKYSCPSGLALFGNQVRVCQLDETSNATHKVYRFSGELPTCKQKVCSVPRPSSQHLRINIATDNSSVTYSCENGYKLVGHSSSSKCASGKWLNPTPDCILPDEDSYCSLPSLIPNAESITLLNVTHHELQYTDHDDEGKRYPVVGVGSRISFKCRKGYQFVGDEIICTGRRNVQKRCSLAELMKQWQAGIWKIKRFVETSNTTYRNEHYKTFCRISLSSNCDLVYWAGMVTELETKLENVCKDTARAGAGTSPLPCRLDDYIKKLSSIETDSTGRPSLCGLITAYDGLDECLKKNAGSIGSLQRRMLSDFRHVLHAHHHCGHAYCNFFFAQPSPPTSGSCEWKKCQPGKALPSKILNICDPSGKLTYDEQVSPYVGQDPRKRIEFNKQNARLSNGRLGYWFSRMPHRLACADIQAPRFTFCPNSISNVSGTVLSTIDKIVKGVNDSVDSNPIIRVLVTSPDIPKFRHRYLSPTDLKTEDINGAYLTFVASDQDGNIALCSVRGPSKMSCAKKYITLSVEKKGDKFEVKTPTEKLVSSSVGESYKMPDQSGGIYPGVLTVVGEDFARNKKTCLVKYTLTTRYCVKSMLNIPKGASLKVDFKKITETYVTADVRCTKAGYQPNHKTFTCKDGAWFPSSAVPDCSKTFDPLEVNFQLFITARIQGKVLSVNETDECLMAYFEKNIIFTKTWLSESCKGIIKRPYYNSKRGNQEVYTVITAIYARSDTNNDVKKCADATLDLLNRQYIQKSFSANEGTCPKDFIFTIHKAEITGYTYSKCFHPNAYHKNLTMIVGLTVSNSRITVDLKKKCWEQYVQRIHQNFLQGQCNGVSLQSTHSVPVSQTGNITADIGVVTNSYRGTMSSLRSCWFGFVKWAKRYVGTSLNVTGLSSCLPGFYGVTLEVEETTNYCDPGKVPIAGHASKGHFCPAGMYASENRCLHCPPGTSSGVGDTSCGIDGAETQCRPGYFSRTGFEPCDICERGTYSEYNMSKSCTRCPCGQLTPRPGAMSRRACGAQSEKEMYCLKKVITEYVYNRLQTTGHPQVIGGGYNVSVTHNRHISVPLVYGRQYKLEATGVDHWGRSLTCNYTYRIESRFCSPDSLIIPEGVRIKYCTPSNAIDRISESYTCSFECTNSSERFYGEDYHCWMGKSWSPSRRVTSCVAVPCPAGQYENKSPKGCFPVPKGYYSEQGKDMEKCPSGTSTEYAQSTSKGDCIALCKPGTYSNTGLEPCNDCEKGTYSDSEGATGCKECDVCKTTTGLGSESSKHCSDRSCQPGTYSYSGDKPCFSCQFHHFASKSGETQCQKCPYGKVTLKPGASQCSPADQLQRISRTDRVASNTSITLVKYYSDESTELHYETIYSYLNAKASHHPYSGSVNVSYGLHTIQVAANRDGGMHSFDRFQIDVRPPDCKPTERFPLSRNAERTCQTIITPINTSEINCTFTCNPGYTFADRTTQKTFLCGEGQSWYNESHVVPDCLDRLNMGYTVIQHVYVYVGDPAPLHHKACVYATGSAILRQLAKTDLREACKAKFPNSKALRLRVREETMRYFPRVHRTFELYVTLKIDIQSSGHTSDVDCFKLILKSLTNDRFRLPSLPDCFKIHFRNVKPIAAQGYYPCPQNSYRIRDQTTLMDRCVLCSTGTFLYKTSCDKCPMGTYQDEIGSTSCKKCPPGTSTYRTHSKSFEDCIVQCNEYGMVNKTSGLPPCYECPQDTFPIAPDKCESCQNSNDTVLCPGTGGWCNACGRIGTASCDNGNQDVPCNCKLHYAGKFCQINLKKSACKSSPCQNGGRCFPSHLDTEKGYKCFCPAGFEGPYCERNVNNCNDHQCKFGTCLDGNGTYICHCHEGYKGRNCATPIDECLSAPCVNGYCEKRTNGFFCNCDGTEFTGKYCNETSDACESNPCLNEGKCLTFSGNSTFDRCDCKNGTSGRWCEKVHSPCESTPQPCKNGGLCIPGFASSFQCICEHKSVWTGKLCDVKRTSCLPNPCRNKGTCTSKGDGRSYTCACPLVSGKRIYYGQNCEKVAPCEENPCKYGKCLEQGHGWSCDCVDGFQGRTCDETIDMCTLRDSLGQPFCSPKTSLSCKNLFIDGKVNYTCVCKEGFSGQNCTDDIDECVRNPCGQNATCKNLLGDYQCECPSGWTGKNCESSQNACDVSAPCKNGGDCKRTLTGFNCSCPRNWKGKTCEEDVNECENKFTCKNGKCTNTLGDFTCSCKDGYRGKLCEEMINMCDKSPCKHNGVCKRLLNGYMCACPDETLGPNCETRVNDCTKVTEPCGHHGTCVDGWLSYSCRCPYGRTGPKCGKVKPSNFDLLFLGYNSTSRSSKTVSVSESDALTIEFFVRFGKYQGNETFITMTTENQGLSRNLLVYYGKGVTLSMLQNSPKVIDASVNNADWHYVVIRIGRGKLVLHRNGVKMLEENQRFLGVSGRLHVTLGTPPSKLLRGRHGFSGEISRFNVYGRILDTGTTSSVLNECKRHARNGDIFSWLMFDMDLVNVKKAEPSICGISKLCDKGFKGKHCNIQRDTIAPKVISCPRNIIKVNATHRLNHYSWPKPQFSDNVGIDRIKTNHRSGEVFAYGEYAIEYVAYDAEGNAAICRFKLFVLASQCPDPAPPHNGMAAIGKVSWGKFAKIQCKNFLFSFSIPPPPFYTCLADGTWYPVKSKNQPLIFPRCETNFPPFLRVILGLLKIPIDKCDNDRKRALGDKLSQIINGLDAKYSICEGICDTSNIVVSCDDGKKGGRRKRNAIEDKRKAIISYNLPNIKINSTDIRVILNAGNVATLLDIILRLIKEQLPRVSGLKDSKVEDVDIETTPSCPEGAVLGVNNLCVNCSQGTFFEKQGKVHRCVDCERGTYQDEEAKSVCKQCGVGYTTLTEGSHNESQCYPICSQGSFYDQERQKCTKCGLGYYQENQGMFSCISCPNGQTTRGVGSVSKDNCSELCGPGYELAANGKCAVCPLGTYRGSANQSACVQCPYTDSTIFSTLKTASTSEDMCSVVLCEVGHYQETTGCHPCPLGMYQPMISTNTSCIRCPIGMTTVSEKSTAATDCQPGTVDECLIASHDCDVNAVCSDTIDSFSCACKSDYVGDGRSCEHVVKCPADHCQNGGTCNMILGVAKCSCPEMFSGDRCGNKTSSGLSPTTIFIIAGLGLLFLIVAVLTVVFLCCCKRRRNKDPTSTKASTSPSLASDLEFSETVLGGSDGDPTMDPWPDYLEDDRESGQRTPPVDYNQDSSSDESTDTDVPPPWLPVIYLRKESNSNFRDSFS